MLLLSLSNIANAQEGTVDYGREKERKSMRIVYVYVYVCIRAHEVKNEVGDREEVSWTSMDIRYPYIPIGGRKGHGNRQRRWYL